VPRGNDSAAEVSMNACAVDVGVRVLGAQIQIAPPTMFNCGFCVINLTLTERTGFQVNGIDVALHPAREWDRVVCHGSMPPALTDG
jgi:hypothetical protein